MRRTRTPSGQRGTRAGRPLDADDAFVAVLIAAMEASGHVSADEAARAHDIIWATRRFRHRSGEAVGRRIERMRRRYRERGPDVLIEEAARRIPRRLRLPAFTVAADIMLVDGRLTRAERAFLDGLGARLELGRDDVRRAREIIQIKNAL